MGTAITIGVIVVTIVGFVVWISVSNRKAGADSQQAGDLKKTTDIREKQLEEANKPRDPKSVADSLHDGSF